MKARMILIACGMVAALLLAQPIGAQVKPQPMGQPALAVDRPAANQSPILTTIQLTATSPEQLNRNSDVIAPAGGGGGVSPYHKERQRLTNNDLTDEYPVTAFNPKRNEYLVVWEQNDGTVTRIIGQRTTNRGIPIGGSFIIASGPDDMLPSIGYNSYHGEYLVTYVRGLATGLDIYGRIVLGNGALWGSELTIDASAGYQGSPSIAFNPTATNHGHPGEYLIVYQANDEIVAKHVGSYGDVDASPQLIAGSAEFHFADVAYNPARNEYLVTYTEIISITPSDHDSNVLARRLGADGALLGTPISIAPGFDQANLSQVAVGDDTYFIVYGYGPNNSGIHTHIAGAWLTGTGEPISASFISRSSSYDLHFPKVSNTGDGFLVFWETDQSDGTSNLDARYVHTQPGFWSDVFTIDDAVYDQRFGDVACATGSCLIVETDNSYEYGFEFEIVAWNVWLQQVFLPLVLK